MHRGTGMEKRQIGIEEWMEMSRSGLKVPITTLLQGDSMRPLIRLGKDPVTIVPVTEPLQIGDVVLFTDGKRYVVHRLWKLDPESGIAQTWGDNCKVPDAPVPLAQVYGKVVSYTRNGRVHRLDTERARSFGLFWMKHGLVRRFEILLYRIVRKLHKIISGK